MTAVTVLAFRVKNQFSARRVPGNLGLALLVFLGGVALVWILGTLLTLRFGDTGNFGRAGYHVYDSMVGELGRFPGPDAIHSPLWVRFVVGVLGASSSSGRPTCCSGPPRPPHFLTAADDARVRTLLRDYGDLDSLGYFATRRDKSVDLGHRRPGHGPGRCVVPRRSARSAWPAGTRSAIRSTGPTRSRPGGGRPATPGCRWR